MTAATHDEIVSLVGDVDDLLLERLVATGASVDEIREARADLDDEHRFQESRIVGVSPRVAEVRSILQETLDDLDDDADAAVARDV